MIPVKLLWRKGNLKQHGEVEHDKDLLGLRVWVGSFVLLPLVDIVHCCLSRESDCGGAVCGEEVVGGDGDGEIGA